MMRDLASNVGARESVRPAVHGDTVTGQTVDTRGFQSAAVVIAGGAIVGAGNFTPKLQHSTTTENGDFADVAAADLVGEFVAAMVANTVYVVGYTGPRRYLRVVLTKNSGTSIAASAVVVLGNAGLRPAA